MVRHTRRMVRHKGRMVYSSANFARLRAVKRAYVANTLFETPWSIPT